MFGEFQLTNSGELGGWTLKMQSAKKLPQDVASAYTEVFGEPRVGAKYIPIYYVADQLVNGSNHKLISEREKMVSGGKIIKDFAITTINIPLGTVGGKGATKVSETDSTDFILRDEVETGFKKAVAEFTSAAFTPIMELGTQVTKGTDYHFLCETKPNYSNEIYLTRVVINNFNDAWSIVEIEKLS